MRPSNNFRGTDFISKQVWCIMNRGTPKLHYTWSGEKKKTSGALYLKIQSLPL